MSPEIFTLVILMAIGGFTISIISLIFSFKTKSGDASLGYGLLTLFLFLGTIAAISSVILQK
jgi:hypothetical protein